jgi:hypothetical protein
MSTSKHSPKISYHASCPICTHRKRAEIERDCLLLNYGDDPACKSLKDIAEQYHVQYKDLQVHVLMHIPLEESMSDVMQETIPSTTGDSSSDVSKEPTSIAGQIRLREAAILRQTMEESYVTFKNLSGKINQIVSRHTDDSPTLQQITKPLTDLYLGTSQSIRATADTLMKMNLCVNGEKDEGLASITKLVTAIHSSQNSTALLGSDEAEDT